MLSLFIIIKSVPASRYAIDPDDHTLDHSLAVSSRLAIIGSDTPRLTISKP